jgi:gluconokinase
MRESETAAGQPQVIVIMGVTGSGKTTIGHALAAELGWLFLDGDDYHPPENIARMAAGIPLTDSDREPWLKSLNHMLREQSLSGSSLVLACSALKRDYRRQLADGVDSLIFIYLKLDVSMVSERLSDRQGHFMPPELLASQFDILEEPQDAVVIDASSDARAIVREILDRLN